MTNVTFITVKTRFECWSMTVFTRTPRDQRTTVRGYLAVNRWLPVIHFDTTLYFLSTFLPCHHQNCLLDLDRCGYFVLLEIVASEHLLSFWILSRQQPKLQPARKIVNQMYIRDLKTFVLNQSRPTFVVGGRCGRKQTCFDIVHSFLLLNSSATDVVILSYFAISFSRAHLVHLKNRFIRLFFLFCFFFEFCHFISQIEAIVVIITDFIL